jgi:hypothetical protein
MTSNICRPWTAEDYKHLQRRGAGSGKQEVQRQAITLALLEYHERSDKEIGRVINCHPQTISNVRSSLEKSGKISHYRHRFSHDLEMIKKIKQAPARG